MSDVWNVAGESQVTVALGDLPAPKSIDRAELIKKLEAMKRETVRIAHHEEEQRYNAALDDVIEMMRDEE
tara:strand:+ start:96 stop:305 length:210 start_codon:yes stop_codon:yes gene_type:complete